MKGYGWPSAACGYMLLALSLTAQVPSPTQRTTPDPKDPVPVFRVTAVSRVAKAVNFHHRQGSTNMDLKPVQGNPKMEGRVKIDSKTGATRVDAWVNNMPPPSSFGEEYLTYVLWAITPEGRAQNLGELLLNRNDDDAKLQAATELQAFGLIVTAEPYYAVTQPSDTVVMEAVVSDGTAGTITPIDVKYELLQRGAYAAQLPAGDRIKITDRDNIPIDLLEARHAYNIARAFGGERYAADTMKKAAVDLKNAEDIFSSRSGDKKKVQTLARNVTQISEDARIISLRRQEEERLEAERQAQAAQVARAEAEAELQTRQRQQADLQRQQAEQDRLRAETERLNAQRAAQQAEADRLAAQQRAAEARAAAEASAAEQARLAAEAEAAKRAAAEQAEASRRAAAEAEAERARLNAERAAARAALRNQLNQALETRETARGLIMNMPDVLFAFDKFDLTADAKVRLARVAGIIATQQGLKVEVEGHTDSVGSDEYNQKLSENRARAVQTFLTAQGVPAAAITAVGFGESKPIADNSSNQGRSQNRRVELVVSGEAITPLSDPAAPTAQNQ